MDTQLRLINSSPPGHARGRTWQLSEKTRRIGQEGVARARDELRRARPQHDDGGGSGDGGRQPSAA